jgi:methylglutaconyl-CoA hydratase
MDQTGTGYVKTYIIDRIAAIEFYHPAHNSLPGFLLSELALSIQQASLNEEVKVILIRSGGERTFCAGASFDELINIKNIEEGVDFFKGFANVINACRTCSKLIVGRVQGKAIGGGVGIAAAMDYCMATKYASVKLSELALGIGPFVVGPAVERKIGKAAFSHLAINATEWQTARWGKDKGLFDEVFDQTDQLDHYLDHFLENLSRMSTVAMQELKSTLWEGTEHWEELLTKRARISGGLILSRESRDALKKVKTKS